MRRRGLLEGANDAMDYRKQFSRSGKIEDVRSKA